MRISSPSNEKIKAVVQLQTKASVRKKQKLFVVEGIKMYDEIPESDIETTYVSEKFYEENIKNGKISERTKKRLNNKEYIIGNCEDGIDFEARKKLLEDSKIENEICKECDLRKRCKHVCPCKNYMATKSINGLSPIVCEFERIIIEIADEMAENLYKKGSKLFIQKFYNENYGIIKEILKKQEKGM